MCFLNFYSFLLYYSPFIKYRSYSTFSVSKFSWLFVLPLNYTKQVCILLLNVLDLSDLSYKYMHVYFLGITSLIHSSSSILDDNFFWMKIEKIICINSFLRKLVLRFAFACGTTFPFLIVEENSTTNLLFSLVKLVKNRVYRKLFTRRFLIGLLETHRSNTLIEKLYCTKYLSSVYTFPSIYICFAFILSVTGCNQFSRIWIASYTSYPLGFGIEFLSLLLWNLEFAWKVWLM